MRLIRNLVRNLRDAEYQLAVGAPAALAETIVTELQSVGPNWTGTFMNAWRIVPGDQDVPPSIVRRNSRYNPQTPVRQIAPILGGGLRTRRIISGNLFTIGNAATHRLVAMDINPGRIRENGRQTADQDWFANYMEGGRFNQTVRVTLDRRLQEAFNNR